MTNSFGIIIQARTGSTRLPNKMILPFAQETSILELILRKFYGRYNVILATTIAKGDDALVEIAERIGVPVYRGSEEDVLERFIGAAEKAGIDKIVRVCADNPFISSDLIDRLIKEFKGEDYLSFRLSNGKPTILGHLGVFAEITTLSALKKVQEMTDDMFYHEHVTNYIYNHTDDFNVRLIDLPAEIGNYEDIRLTVDTQGDFDAAKSLYAAFGEASTPAEIGEMIRHIRSNNVLLSTMKQEITKNTK